MTKEALAPLLLAGSQSDPEFMQSFAYLLTLPDRVVGAMKEIGLDAEDLQWYLQWEAPVRSALRHSLALTTPINNVQARYKDDHIMNLEACARVLNRERSTSLEPEAVSDFNGRARALYDDIAASPDLADDLKRFLLEQLQEILRAFDEFDLRGPQGLSDACERGIGAFMTRHEVTRHFNDNETSHTLLKKFGGYLRELSLAVASAALLELALTAGPAVYSEIFNQPPAIEQSVPSTDGRLHEVLPPGAGTADIPAE